MRVVVLAVPDMLDSGLTSVLDVLSSANTLHADVGLSTPPFRVELVGTAHRVRTAHGLGVPASPWESLIDAPPEMLVLPSLGIRPADDLVDLVRRSPVLDVVGKLREQGVRVAASCSGTLFLAEAGVLDGRTATTSWWLADTFRARYPAVDLDENRVVVADDDVVTGGAGFAHVDLTLALVAQTSPALSDLVAQYLVAGRRATQTGLSTAVRHVGTAPLLVAFERHVRSDLRTPATIAELAAAVGTSERSLQRLTADTLQISPTRFVQEIRLDHAVHLLTTTDRSAEQVAEAVGYRNADTLRRLLRRRRGTSLRDLRHRSAPAAFS